MYFGDVFVSLFLARLHENGYRYYGSWDAALNFDQSQNRWSKKAEKD